MPRSIRLELVGGYYHVMARGNRREKIFLDDDDRRFFLQALGETCERTGWRVHAWVLMGNHYHVLLETPEPNLVEGMKWLQNTYTRRFNVRHRLWGRLFGDRYKAVLVEGGGYYYETLLNYIHLTPVRARLVNPEAGTGVMDYPWSSIAGGYALRPSQRPKWLAAEDGLEAFGLKDTVQGRREFAERLDRRALEEGRLRAGIPEPVAGRDQRRSDLCKGWYWGSQAFAEKMLQLGESVLGRERHWSYRQSEESKSHGEMEAERLLEEGLELSGLQRDELTSLPGSDPRKIAIALRIERSTTVSRSWLAQRLGMKSAANVRQYIWLVKSGRRELTELSRKMEKCKNS